MFGILIYDGTCINDLHCLHYFLNIMNLSLAKLIMKHIFKNFIGSICYEKYRTLSRKVKDVTYIYDLYYSHNVKNILITNLQIKWFL